MLVSRRTVLRLVRPGARVDERGQKLSDITHARIDPDGTLTAGCGTRLGKAPPGSGLIQNELGQLELELPMAPVLVVADKATTDALSPCSVQVLSKTNRFRLVEQRWL